MAGVVGLALLLLARGQLHMALIVLGAGLPFLLGRGGGIIRPTEFFTGRAVGGHIKQVRKRRVLTEFEQGIQRRVGTGEFRGDFDLLVDEYRRQLGVFGPFEARDRDRTKAVIIK